MIPEERRKQILDLVGCIGYLSVSELARKLYVSEPTVRRDLVFLEQEGSIKRTHGGASFIANGSFVWPFDLRRRVNLDEKNYIGRLAAHLVQDGDHIFIDSGSTAYCFAKELDPAIKLTVMTNCIPIAQILAEHATKTVELPCGCYDPRDASIHGEEAISSIERRWAKYFFVSTGSFSAEKGFIGFDSQGMPAKHAFHQHAEKTVLLMDHSKTMQDGYYRVFDWKEIDILVTDKPLEGSLLECCKKYNVQLIC